ncbi:hypothetical protein ACB268_21345, partial [Aeromonas sanarellii]
VCKRHKQTEYLGPTCQKAPSVEVTWGWGSHDLLADLGNNAVRTMTGLIDEMMAHGNPWSWGRVKPAS